MHSIPKRIREARTLQFHPFPPWSRKPPSPTSGQCPPQNVLPLPPAARNAFSRRPVQLGGHATILVRGSYSKPAVSPCVLPPGSPPRSTRMASSRTLHPAQLCPPLRTLTRHPSSRASCTARTTSVTEAACTTARGFRSATARRWLNTGPQTAAWNTSGSVKARWRIGKSAITSRRGVVSAGSTALFLPTCR